MTVTEFVHHPERDTLVLLDVRDSEERRKGRFVEGSLHVPLPEILAGENFGVDYQTPIVVLCERGARAQVVAQYLSACGFVSVSRLEGGYRELAPYVVENELPVT